MYNESKYLLGELIKQRLAYLLGEGNFNFNGTENIMFNMCMEDFINYLKYRWLKPKDYVDENTFNKYLDIHAQTEFFKYLQDTDNLKDIKDELNMWISLWLGKFKERTEILFTDRKIYNNNNDEQLAEINDINITKINRDLEAYKETIIFTLITMGEFSCTNIISEYIISKEFRKVHDTPTKIKDKLDFVNKCMKEARKIVEYKNAFVFIKVKEFKWE